MRGKPHQRVMPPAGRRIIPAHAGQTRALARPDQRRTDHPRACGANSSGAFSMIRLIGSSPRMRGKRVGSVPVGILARIIPAHAGQTQSHQRNGKEDADHPRACGANHVPQQDARQPRGSSPRMRGKLEVKEFKSTATRIIPAHAGQTSPRWWAPSFRTDHPRACGANDDFLVQLGAMVGSSPRMRGKRCVGRVQHPWPRIIPAHAGQTRRDISTSGRSPDHPRACGANAWSPVYGRQDAGSSPRMRGKLHQVQRATHADRIIPAHAGQTRARSRRPYPPTDHPRACGANTWALTGSIKEDGSSPRMRGKLFHNCSVLCFVRIIPAHAGQTMVAGRHSTPSTDHPRACGANSVRLSKRRHATGSSPRMRGKRTAA